MESGEKLGSGKSFKTYLNSHCSIPDDYTSSRDLSNWPNEWESLFNDSESSDFLSQSVASSTSWSDELEGDLAKSLQDQMRLVESTLYRDGNQQLSARSDLREECRLWQKNFPHLRIVGEAVKPSVGCQTRSRQEELEEQIEEIIAAHGDYDDNASIKVGAKKETTHDANEIYKEKIKKAVIDQIFARIWPEVVKKIEPVLQRAAENREQVVTFSPSLNLKDDDSFDDGLTSGFNSLTLVEDLSTNSLRIRSGRRSGVSVRKNLTSAVTIKPVVLECSIPIPHSVTVRTSSALRRSPARGTQANLAVKYPSPERLLSPLVLQNEMKTVVKSAGGRKARGSGDRKQECRQRPQYDAKTGRMISRDDSRDEEFKHAKEWVLEPPSELKLAKSGIRRNIKTSPSLPWSRHGALPPIEISEVGPKSVDSISKRSTSALYKGRLNSGSRPNTSLTAKNQVVLSPLDSLQIRQSSVAAPKHWLPEQHSYVNCEVLQLRPGEQRHRWRNRSNIVKNNKY